MTPRSHLVRLGVMAASALLALGAVETGLRAFNPQPLVAPLHEEVVGVIAPMAGARGRFYIPGVFDTTISINAQRFRGGAPVEAKPQAGTTRIAMLGDSMTFGYAAALSARRRSAGSPPAGPASGPARAGALQEAELLYLRDRVVRDHARLVVIFIPARGALYPEMPAAEQDLSESAAIFGMLAKTCEREGILWFDATSRVRELAAAARTRFFLDRDAHPTAAGYDAIAEAVSGFLRPLL